jgi:hypothetical protein
MDRRLALLVLLSAAAVAAACGPHSRSRAEALAAVRAVATVAVAPGRAADPDGALLATTAAERRKRSPRDSALGAELTVRAEDGVRFALALANPSKHRVEVTFPDGRTREFAVYDAAGREVWRWSAGRLFTQTMQARLIGAGDSVVFDGRWPSPAPGRYTVVAQLRSDNHPVVRRVAFEVPAAAPLSQLAAH